MTDALRVLLVEDSPTDARLILHALKGVGRPIEHLRVDEPETMRAALRDRTWDVVLSDWSMPQFTALRALEVLKETELDLPFIIVSGTIGEDLAVLAMRAGAHDYLLKDKLTRLAPAVEREARESAGRRARRATAKALFESESRYRRIVETTGEGVWVVDPEGKTTFVNPQMAAMLGREAPQIIGRSPVEYLDDEGRAIFAKSTAADREGLALAPQKLEKRRQGEIRFVRPDGTIRWGLVESTPLYDAAGAHEGVLAMVMDVTDKKRAEQALYVRMCVAELTGDVGIVLADGSELSETLTLCATAIVQHLGVALARIWTLDAAAGVLELAASAGIDPQIDGRDSRIPMGERKIGRIAEERRTQVTNDLSTDPSPDDPEWTQREGLVAFAGYPLVVGSETVGVMAAFSKSALSDVVLNGLEAIADAIAVGIRRKHVERANAGLEAQLRQSQKMEAIGRLAGGVAHDFNNMLSVILSYGDMILGDLSPSDPLRPDVEEIRNAGNRAAALTRQLLMFSRQQVLEPKDLDLNELVGGMDKMLQRMVGEDVTVVWVAEPTPLAVRVDRGSIEQVIMNLVVNARDAMPTGGTLTIETAAVTLDEDYARANIGSTAGAHVMLTVSDTGAGMDRATQARIFEPFFTTKDKTKGSGLGLSTVFGIVQQSTGTISVESEEGKGTAIKILLPCSGANVAKVARRESSTAPMRGTEFILLVEDEEQVRVVARGILRRHGYEVLEAKNAAEAIALSESRAGKIHLLLSDVVMPQMSGPELARRLVAARPDMKVLCMSGYTDDMIVRHGVSEAEIAFLQKPITPTSLTAKVREVLDAV